MHRPAQRHAEQGQRGHRHGRALSPGARGGTVLGSPSSSRFSRGCGEHPGAPRTDTRGQTHGSSCWCRERAPAGARLPASHGQHAHQLKGRNHKQQRHICLSGLYNAMPFNKLDLTYSYIFAHSSSNSCCLGQIPALFLAEAGDELGDRGICARCSALLPASRAGLGELNSE